VPTGLAATASATQVNLSWAPVTDSGGCGVAGYSVYRDNRLIGTTQSTTYSDANVTPNTRYRYRAAAYDRVGNSSPRSHQIQVRVP
jgi:chitodextrinase